MKFLEKNDFGDPDPFPTSFRTPKSPTKKKMPPLSKAVSVSDNNKPRYKVPINKVATGKLGGESWVICLKAIINKREVYN